MLERDEGVDCACTVVVTCVDGECLEEEMRGGSGVEWSLVVLERDERSLTMDQHWLLTHTVLIWTNH